MESLALLATAEAHGMTLSAEGNELVIRGPLSAKGLVTEIVEHKEEILAILGQRQTDPGPIVDLDELEVLMQLGSRLASDEIAALKCGITHLRCCACRGIPCRGSAPWDA